MAMCTSLAGERKVGGLVMVDILDFDYDTLRVNGVVEGSQICIYSRDLFCYYVYFRTRTLRGELESCFCFRVLQNPRVSLDQVVTISSTFRAFDAKVENVVLARELNFALQSIGNVRSLRSSDLRCCLVFDIQATSVSAWLEVNHAWAVLAFRLP